ncbi:MAG TPA: MarR family winged helix-turn-helix transcriptional regulator [Alphaproteobacteria bacterium]|jgi:DNA-binding MarR family transcriptional regulator|nr:MarR family winged helix-turn-helix transcriptional regulator [Alphaproteobacteria bacterium]
MPADGAARLRPRSRPGRRGTFVPPLTVTLPAVLTDGSDREFRRVIYGLFVCAARLHDIRDAFGRRIAMTGARYTVLIATAHLQGGAGVGVRTLADYLHVAPPHVTTEVGKLVAAGLLGKERNPDDGRGVLVSLTPKGAEALEALAPFLRRINDILFDGITRAEFAAVVRFIDKFVVNTGRAELAIAEDERGRRNGGRD